MPLREDLNALIFFINRFGCDIGYSVDIENENIILVFAECNRNDIKRMKSDFLYFTLCHIKPC